MDSLKLLKEINKRGRENNRKTDCLLQVYIAREETKYGLDFNETTAILASEVLHEMEFVRIKGFMGMAPFTRNETQLGKEFSGLRTFFEQCRQRFDTSNINLQELSMGMSGDYLIAAREGSTMVRVGSALFGAERSISQATYTVVLFCLPARLWNVLHDLHKFLKIRFFFSHILFIQRVMIEPDTVKMSHRGIVAYVDVLQAAHSLVISHFVLGQFPSDVFGIAEHLVPVADIYFVVLIQRVGHSSCNR